MLAIAMGIATGLVYGFADFFGALASRKLRPLLVTGLAGWAGLAALSVAICTGTLHAGFTPATVLAGFVGGLFSAGALASLYQGLALGPISIVSPLAAVTGAIVPAVVGSVFLNETFGFTAWIAIALILVAIVLVGYHPEGSSAQRPTARSLGFGLFAGLGIGAVLVSLHSAPATDGVGAILLMRVVNAMILGAVLAGILVREKGRVSDFADIGVSMWFTIFATGFLDATANVLFVFASRIGSLTVVSVLTSLYPLGTILLARIVLKEKLSANQNIGVALALLASVMLAVR